jgi:hypothetical protein
VGNKRTSLSKKTRFEVFKRDGFRCQYCGACAPDVLLVVDHIVPVASGGKNNVLNLLTACEPCNAGKGARELGDHSVLEKQRDQLQQLSERREQLEMMIRWKEGMCDLRTAAVDRLSDLWTRLVPGYSLNEKGRQELKKLAGRYEVREVMEAMEIASTRYIEVENGKATLASAENAWRKVTGVLRMRELEKSKPYIRDLLYVRGILKNRMWLPTYGVIEVIESAHLAGSSIAEIKALARNARSWADFQGDLKDAVA